MDNKLVAYISDLKVGIESIPKERKLLLEPFANYVRNHLNDDLVNLNFICVHNSRRSHFAQVWAQIAAHYYGFDQVRCYSGGTEATAIYPMVVNTLRETGIHIDQQTHENNPVYMIGYNAESDSIKGFSKKYDDGYNPQKYVAIMVCSEAGEMCPFIPEANARFVIPYNDPKEFDQTEFEREKYKERCYQIASEMFYVFSKI